MGIPMPNDTLMVQDTRAIVVASVHVTDTEYTVVLLMPTAPFYRVAEVDDEGRVTVLGSEQNIVLAVESYETHGGDL